MIVIGILLAYAAAAYYIMYRSLKRSAGPGGLAWFALPLAPLAGPAYVWYGIKSVIGKR